MHVSFLGFASWRQMQQMQHIAHELWGRAFLQWACPKGASGSPPEGSGDVVLV